MPQRDTADLVADYIARGGKINKIPTGVSSNQPFHKKDRGWKSVLYEEPERPVFDRHSYALRAAYLEELIEGTSFVRKGESEWEPIVDGALEELTEKERRYVLGRLRAFAKDADENLD